MSDTSTVMSLTAKIEAIIFASPQPISAATIAQVLDDETVDVPTIASICEQLAVEYRQRASGVELVTSEKAAKKSAEFRLQTIPVAAPILRKLGNYQSRPLSRAALETLAIVAYRQPVTRAEIDYIRGVDSAHLVKTLTDRDLLECVGRKEGAGKPLLFGTTPHFLQIFSLHSMDDLPKLDSLQMTEEDRQLAERKIADPRAINLEEVVGAAEETEEKKVQDNMQKQGEEE